MGACSSTLDEKDLDEVDAARLPSNERTDSDVDLGEIDLEVNNDDIAKTLDSGSFIDRSKRYVFWDGILYLFFQVRCV